MIISIIYSWSIIINLEICLGALTSHTNYFKDIRNARLERYAYETNKLLIRLDKLLNNLPSDPVDRKSKDVQKSSHIALYFMMYIFHCTAKA